MLEFDLIKGNRERLYDLAYDADDKSLELRMPQDVADFVHSKLSCPDAKIIPHLQKELKLLDFEYPNQDRWGFASLISEVQDKDSGEMTLKCPIPKIERGTWENYQLLPALSANLKLIFSCLSLAKRDGENLGSQLLHIRMDTQRGAAPVAAIVGPSMVSWLNRQRGNYYDHGIEQIMQEAYCHMTTAGSLLDEARFQVLFRQPKWVNLTCPGNACGLDPENYSEQDLNKGYQLLPHNVDTVTQQLTLLVGMAAIHSRARNELRQTSSREEFFDRS